MNGNEKKMNQEKSKTKAERKPNRIKHKVFKFVVYFLYYQLGL